MKTEKQTQKKKLKQLSSLELVTATAHDMKTPLVLMSGLAERLLSANITEAQRQQYLERISISSDRLLQLVESLSAAQVSKRRQVAAELSPLNVSLVLDQVIDELSLHAEHRHQKLQLVSSKPVVVLSDRLALYRIVLNLVDNAIKYSRPNSTIIVKLSQREGEATVSVRDCGPGFRKDDLERIFSMFGRATEPTNALPGSSGMGLFISRQLADSIEGSLQVTTLKDGSAFSLRLPLAGQMRMF